jgi:hypothetical protein
MAAMRHFSSDTVVSNAAWILLCPIRVILRILRTSAFWNRLCFIVPPSQCVSCDVSEIFPHCTIYPIPASLPWCFSMDMCLPVHLDICANDEIPHYSVYQRQAHMRYWDSMGSRVRYRQVAVIGSPWVESPVPGKGPGQTLNPPMLRGNTDVDSLECFRLPLRGSLRFKS